MKIQRVLQKATNDFKGLQNTFQEAGKLRKV
jgi:hypothetical protein